MRRLRSRKNHADQRPAGALAANAAKPIESPVQPNAEATQQTDRSNPRAWLAWPSRGKRYSVAELRYGGRFEWEVPVAKPPVTFAPSGNATLSGFEKRAYVHTLSLRLTSEQYRRLRKFVTTYEDKTESWITHQAVLETALADYLDRH
jgi:hypothetical protein